ncbi:MAG: ubiquinol-cytochrome c reductase iron-sulfur subunit [Planctomycetota bacterium]
MTHAAHDARRDVEEASGRHVEPSRRVLLSGLAAAGAVAGAGGYGVTRVVGYLNPPSRRREREVFLAFVDAIPQGGTLAATLPDGRHLQVRRTGDEFAAFSDVCPHLGCRVHWVPPSSDERNPDKRAGWFRCPCHEGWFDADGRAFAGPPAEAGQQLARVDLVRRGESLYVLYEEETA